MLARAIETGVPLGENAADYVQLRPARMSDQTDENTDLTYAHIDRYAYAYAHDNRSGK